MNKADRRSLLIILSIGSRSGENGFLEPLLSYFQMMQPALNPSQLEILKVMQYLKNETDLAEIKSLVAAYPSAKVVRSAEAAFYEKRYTIEIFEARKADHFCKSACL